MTACLAFSPPPFATISKSRCASSEPTSFNCRPAVILPGLGNKSGDYRNLKDTLEGYGVPTVVANVSRIDWLRNAAGLVDPNYWRGTLRPRPVLDWYLKRVDEAVREAKELAQGHLLKICPGLLIKQGAFCIMFKSIAQKLFILHN